MGIFGGRSGASWWTTSEKDSRFNLSGRADGIWSAQSKIDEAIRAKATELGVDPPDDILVGGMKD